MPVSTVHSMFLTWKFRTYQRKKFQFLAVDFNNFEAKATMKQQRRMKNDLFGRIRADHLNNEDRKVLLKLVAEHQD